MPFGEYENFDACVRANQDKSSPEGYCSAVHKKVTGKWPSEVRKGTLEMLKAFPGVVKYLGKAARPGPKCYGCEKEIKGKVIRVMGTPFHESCANKATKQALKRK